MKDKKLLIGLASGCGCLALLVVAAAVAIFVIAEREPPGPFAGEGSGVVALTSEQGGGTADANVFVARLEALGVEASVEEASDQRIVLSLAGVSDPGAAIAAVLPPRRLAMHLVAVDQGPLTGDEAAAPPGVSVRRSFGEEDPVFAGPDASVLAPIVARAEGLPGHVAAIECQRGEYVEDPPCAAYLLESPPGITNADVERALVSENFADGRPAVRVEFTPAGATRFADLTGRGVRRKLAIVLDGEIVSAPVIQERIAGGVAQISLGGGSFQAQLEEAHGIAASLGTEPLSSTWVVAEVR